MKKSCKNGVKYSKFPGKPYQDPHEQRAACAGGRGALEPGGRGHRGPQVRAQGEGSRMNVSPRD